MSTCVPDALLSHLGEFVADRMGLYFPENRRRDLDRGIARVSAELGFAGAGECIEWLLSTPLTRRQVEVLASHLTVGETYFFREKHSMEMLEQRILPDLIRERRGAGRSLRIWDAGCSTGEEPYSVAIILSRLLPDLRDWNVTILGTDINPCSLKKASDGVYGEWSFRGTPRWIKERYFKSSGEGRLEVVPEVKRMVTFAFHNLAEDSYPSISGNINAMDVILCCNVLMYFKDDRAGSVVQKFFSTLVDGGWLIVGPNDPAHVISGRFRRFGPAGAPIFRKGPEGLWEQEFGEGAHCPPPVFAAKPAASGPASPAGMTGPPVARESVPAGTGQGGAEVRRASPYEEALSLYGQGRYADAADRLAGVEEPRAYALTARACANLGRLAEAAELCGKAVSADRLAPSHRYLLAMVLLETGDTQGAVASLKKVLYLDPGFVLAHVSLGSIAMRQGKTGDMRRHFNNALRLLESYPPGEAVPESEGLTAGRLTEVVISTMFEEDGYGADAA